MFVIYTRRHDDRNGKVDTVLIAAYARKEGAINRAKECAQAEPGHAYFVATLPEGTAPVYDSLTIRWYSAYVTTGEPDETAEFHPLAGMPAADEDLPF